MQASIELRKNPNVSQRTAETVLRSVMNYYPDTEWSGWTYGDNGCTCIVFCDTQDTDGVLSALTALAFIQISM